MFFEYIFKDINWIDKFSVVVGSWMFVDFFWFVNLDKFFVIYNGDMFCYGYCFFLIVGDYYISYIDVF